MADGIEPEKRRGGAAGREKAERRGRELAAKVKAAGVSADLAPFGLRIYANGKKAPPLAGVYRARADGEGFRSLETWLAGNDALFLMRDRGEPLAVLPWAVFAELLKRAA